MNTPQHTPAWWELKTDSYTTDDVDRLRRDASALLAGLRSIEESNPDGNADRAEAITASVLGDGPNAVREAEADRNTTYHIAIEPSAYSPYGRPVLLDNAGNPRRPKDVGLWGRLPPGHCGRVEVVDGDRHVQTYFTGFGESPSRMWDALVRACVEHPGYGTAKIIDAGRVIISR